MSRQYLVGSWSNADTYDYSGEQLMGNRHGKSVCADNHMLPSGKANLSRYGDIEPIKPKAKQRHIRNKICPQNTTLDNLDKQEKELDEAYLAGDDIDDQEYLELSRALEAKRQRAHKSLMRALGLPSDYYALQSSFSDDEGEEVGQPTPTGQRPLYACFSLLKGAFVRCSTLVRSGDYRKVWDGVKKIAKKDEIKFLTKVIGLTILLITATKY